MPEFVPMVTEYRLKVCWSKKFWGFSGEMAGNLNFSENRLKVSWSKNFWGFSGEMALVFSQVTECIGILKRKVSGIFWRNLNFLALVLGAKSFGDFLAQLEFFCLGT